MPQFDYNPAGPKTQVLGDPSSGKYVTLKKKRGKRKPEPQAPYKAPKDQPSQGAASSGSSTSGQSAGRGRGGNNNNQQSNAPTTYNPLYSEFKTPSELRKEAAELAAMGVGSEDALKSVAAQQQAGLGGLTSALTGTLTGIADRTQAGLAGFGNLYSQLAGQAQSAGQSQAAAAGAPTSIAPGASPTMASNLANLSAPTMGYAPAAAVTGAQMVGAVTANLTKALMDRSSKLSADTAKYLYQLKNDEVQRAISQGTLSQNAARLNMTGEENQWQRQMDIAGLNIRQQNANTSAQRAAASAIAAGNKAGKNKQKAIRDTQKDILLNVDKWTGPDAVLSGNREYTIYFTGADGTLAEVPKKVIAASEDDARAKGAANVPVAYAATIQVEEGTPVGRAYTSAELTNRLVRLLVNQGMNRANAIKWVRSNVISGSGI
jgi:hypothetical protein